MFLVSSLRSLFAVHAPKPCFHKPCWFLLFPLVSFLNRAWQRLMEASYEIHSGSKLSKSSSWFYIPTICSLPSFWTLSRSTKGWSNLPPPGLYAFFVQIFACQRAATGPKERLKLLTLIRCFPGQCPSGLQTPLTISLCPVIPTVALKRWQDRIKKWKFTRPTMGLLGVFMVTLLFLGLVGR